MAIAEKGEIPWCLPEDFKHFKKTTMGGTIVMGRKTFESLPKKPLPGRFNIVITRTPAKTAEGFGGQDVYFTNTLSMAFWKALTQNPGQDIFIIGGSEVYNMALDDNYVDKVIASEVHINDVVGDRFFPNLYERNWDAKIIKNYDEFTVMELTPPNPPRQIQMVSAASIDE